MTTTAGRVAGVRRFPRALPDRRLLIARWRFPTLVLLGYLLATVVFTFPLAFQIGQVVPGKEVDGLEHVWDIWWAKEALVDLRRNPFFTDYLYHPSGVSLYFHTLGLGAAPFSLPLQFLMSPTAAHSATLLLLTALAGFNAYWLVYYLVPNRLAAFVGGLVFAVNPYQIYHLSRGWINLSAISWIPLFVLLLLRAAREGRALYAGLAGLVLVLVSLSDWQYAFFCFVFTACFSLWELARAKDWRARFGVLRAGAITGLAYGATIAPLVVAMIRDLLPTRYAQRPYRQLLLHSIDVVALLLPNPNQPLWGGLARPFYDRVYTPSAYPAIGALGYVAVGLAIVALVSRRRAAGFWLLMFALSAILALGPELRLNGATPTVAGRPVSLPYRLYWALPFVNVSRSPCLFLKFGFLMLAVPVALGLDAVMAALTASGRRTLALAAGTLAAAILGLEYLSTPLVAPRIDPIPQFYAQLAAVPANGYAILDVPSVKQDFPMFYQTVHGWPIVGGDLSRDNPHPLYGALLPVTALLGGRDPLGERDIFTPTRLEEVGEAGLAAHRIRYVVVHEGRLGPDDRARVAGAVARIFPGRPPVYEGEGVTVYAVRPPDRVVPFQFGPGWFEVQQLPESRRPYRWIGQRAELHVYAPGEGAGTLTFTAHNFAISYTLQVLVNGVAVGSYPVPGGFGQFQLPIPLGGGDNVVEFAVNLPPQSAADLGLGDDRRRVSVGISELTIAPARP